MADSSPDQAARDFAGTVSALRAIAEPTRLRLCVLLSRGELTVTEICQVIGQSQPRVSRHLRLLDDAGILERSPEGAHAFYRVPDRGVGAELVRLLVDLCPIDDEVTVPDLAALDSVLQARTKAADAYLSVHSSDWDEMRSLHVREEEVEQAMLDLLGDEPIERLVDIGTGTGRILELMAPRTRSSVGLDLSRDMLVVARANLSRARVVSASVRQGDLHRPPFAAHSFDVATMHLVLHLLDDAGSALADAARLLQPQGRLLVVDFAPHDVESLRERHGHRHLGVGDAEMAEWARAAGLTIEAEQTLAPTSDEQRLTVRVWLLRAPDAEALATTGKQEKERAAA